VLEIVEGEAFESYGCAQAYASLTSCCMCWALASLGWPCGINAMVVTWSMPQGRSRREGRSVFELRPQEVGGRLSTDPS
jgi:hypothetical protein